VQMLSRKVAWPAVCVLCHQHPCLSLWSLTVSCLSACRDVFRQPTDVVKALLLGPPGTTVRLGFHRGTDPRAPLIQVALHRQTLGETLVGVGIIFRSDSSGALFVRQLQHGGPAGQSGQVHIGDCVVEVNGLDVFRKPISSFTKLMLGPPGTIVTLGFKRATSQMIERVSLRRSVPAKSTPDADPHLVVNENNIQLRREVENSKDEHLRLKTILESKRESLKEVERMYERGASSMGGQMNDEFQRYKTFEQWPHSESSHPGVTPTILAAEGFHFCPTAQDPDTVVCFFCDLQVHFHFLFLFTFPLLFPSSLSLLLIHAALSSLPFSRFLLTISSTHCHVRVTDVYFAVFVIIRVMRP